MDNVLVIGGAGFIGSNTCDLLLKSRMNPIILDNLSKKTHNSEWPSYVEKFEKYKGDIKDKKILETLLRKSRFVINLAAEMDLIPEYNKMFTTNLVGTSNIYEIIKSKKLNVEKIVVASTQFVYGDGVWNCRQHGLIFPITRTINQLQNQEWDYKCPKCGIKAQFQQHSEEYASPQNHYALSKKFCEDFSLKMSRDMKLPTIMLRYSIVHGSRQSLKSAYSGVLRTFYLNLLSKNKLPTFEDNLSLRDYVSVEDVARANLLSIQSGDAFSGILNIGGGRGYTQIEIAQILSKHMGIDFEFTSDVEYRFGDTRHSVSNITKAKNILNWEPKVSEELSVSNFLEWAGSCKIDLNKFKKQQKRIRRLNIVQKVKK